MLFWFHSFSLWSVLSYLRLPVWEGDRHVCWHCPHALCPPRPAPQGSAVCVPAWALLGLSAAPGELEEQLEVCADTCPAHPAVQGGAQEAWC